MKKMTKIDIFDCLLVILVNERFKARERYEEDPTEQRKNYIDKVLQCYWWVSHQYDRQKDAELRRRLKDSRGK